MFAWRISWFLMIKCFTILCQISHWRWAIFCLHYSEICLCVISHFLFLQRLLLAGTMYRHVRTSQCRRRSCIYQKELFAHSWGGELAVVTGYSASCSLSPLQLLALPMGRRKEAHCWTLEQHLHSREAFLGISRRDLWPRGISPRPMFTYPNFPLLALSCTDADRRRQNSQHSLGAGRVYTTHTIYCIHYATRGDLHEVNILLTLVVRLCLYSQPSGAGLVQVTRSGTTQTEWTAI